MVFAFEKLLVYQKAIDFADRTASLTEQFRRGYRFLVDQLNRAWLSISANIVQGNRRFTKAELEEIARMISGLINGLDKRRV